MPCFPTIGAMCLTDWIRSRLPPRTAQGMRTSLTFSACWRIALRIPTGGMTTLRSGTCPSWRRLTARLCPQYAKGVRSITRTYRRLPISCLSRSGGFEVNFTSGLQGISHPHADILRSAAGSLPNLQGTTPRLTDFAAVSRLAKSRLTTLTQN